MRSRLSLPRVVLATLPLLAAACGEESPAPIEVDPTSLRTTPHGEIVGFTSEAGAHVWRGIPFAKPPLGELRWRAPLPPEAWEGRREALAFGSACVQFAGTMARGDGQEGEPTGGEDCLYLNVFAPRFAPDEVPDGISQRPVMLWIHGGGNTIGEAGMYDASRLVAERDVLVVTLNYRLGVFGWLSHPALREGASWQDASGNYGTLDLVRALEWVQRSIASFGGDPERITIFGESAGAANVLSLLISPAASGRFHRAIAQSGRTRTATLAEAENFTDDPEPGEPNSSREVMLRLLEREGRVSGRGEAKQVLAGMGDAEIADWLRRKPAEEILGLYGTAGLGGMYRVPQLIRDGRVLPREGALELLAQPGRSNEVPVIVGTNRDEDKLFMLFSSPYVRRIGMLPLGLRDARMYELTTSYSSLMWKVRGVDAPAAAIHRVRGDVWAYRFDWDDLRRLLWLDLQQLVGAAHGLEVPFVFSTLRLGGAERYLFRKDHAAADRKLADTITSYWTRFAATGNPGRGRENDLPVWKAWEGPRGSFLILDSEHDAGIRMSDDTVTRDSVIAGVASDSRFQSDEERCVVYAGFVIDDRVMPREDYESLCGPLPEPGR